MNTDLLKKIEEKYYQKARDKFGPGDTVRVYTKIEEGDKTRTQIFAGVVISVKGGGLSQTFTVRKISSGIGVEKIFPTHSPAIERVELVRKGKNKRAKIYYLRNKVGNRALFVAEGDQVTEDDVYVPDDMTEAMAEMETATADSQEAAEVVAEATPEAQEETVEAAPEVVAEEKTEDANPEAASEETPAAEAASEEKEEATA